MSEPWSVEFMVPLREVDPEVVALLLGTEAREGEDSAAVAQRVTATLALERAVSRRFQRRLI